MLQEVYIKNFVLIDELRMEFYDGLNVLTGETGAGKSIIIDALGLIIGGRINNDFIRDQSQKAIIEAVFTLGNNSEAQAFLQENRLLEDDDNRLIICREISAGGRNTARINGRNVPLVLLRELSQYLVDMHLQHDHLNILRPSMFIDYVDQFIADDESITERIAFVFHECRDIQQQLDMLNASEQSRLQQLDMLTFQIEEIEKVNLQPGEEEELLALSKRIKNARQLNEDAAHLVQIMYSNDTGNAYDFLGQILDIIKNNQEEAFFSSLLPAFEDMYYSIENFAREISKYQESLDFEPGQLEEIEERLHVINRLKAKYGKNIDEVQKFLDNARLELQKINNTGQTCEEYEKKIKMLQNEYTLLAASLTEKRIKAAAILQDKVHQELSELNMPDIKFMVSITAREQPAYNGNDDIQFLFSPNAGEPMRPLEKIASGGEMSRFVLALKKALAQIYRVPTLIFDEIDVGVGGSALKAMAMKLDEISKSHQVILVTHSPQVASHADNHFLILKQVNNKRTSTSVKKLDKQTKIEELARMLAGQNYSQLTLQHAKEMVKLAKNN